MKTFLNLALAFLLLPFAAPLAKAADLTVTVNDVRSTNGSVMVAIYDSSTAFMRPPLAKASLKMKADRGHVTFLFHNLPPGKYAISGFHDENGNGKLDVNSLGVPTEGYGFSNDAQGSAGPPKFAQAAFDFDGKGNKVVSFSLNY